MNSEARTVAAGLFSVSKVFGTTVALRDVSIELWAGEVLALVGENGAGKSTCVSFFDGLFPPDTGTVTIAGEPIVLESASHARAHGIAVVHQHPALFPDMSVADNIFAGQLPRNGWGLIEQRRIVAESERLTALLGLDAGPDTLVRELRTGEAQLVEIARALANDVKVLILDEPTAALTSHEARRLFQVVETLRAGGVAVMFVGHRLEEVFAVADRIAVLRDGRLVATRQAAELSPAGVVALMVGRELVEVYPHQPAPPGAEVLRVKGLSADGEFAGVSFAVRAGEIVGLAGLVGAGRTEVARAIFGVTRPSAGQVWIDGERVRIGSARAAMEHGVAYVSEDRRGQSLVGDFSILDNASLPLLSRTSRFGFVSRRGNLAMIQEALTTMRLRFARYSQPVSDLSGGNQQKVVLAKWLATSPKLLILDEPTQGIDVGSKVEVHRIMDSLAHSGLAILLISSDMPELLSMSDRVLVMRHGRVVAELDREAATQEAVGAAAAGVVLEAEVSEAAAEPRPGSVPAVVPGAVPDRPPRPAAAARPGGRARRRGRLGRAALNNRDLRLLAAMLLFAVPIGVVNASFLSWSNINNILVGAALFGLIAAGEMIVVLTRNIDVSVSSTAGLSAYLVSLTLRGYPEIPWGLAVLLAVAVGIGCGAVNAVIVAWLDVPAIVATLGTLAVFRGAVAFIASTRPPSMQQVSISEFPRSWLELTAISVGGVNILVLVALAVFLVLALVLRGTPAGREFYAVGSNPSAAARIGLRIRRNVSIAFVTSGALAGLAGALASSYYGTVDPRFMSGIELNIVAAVVVGGVLITGGVGTALGVALGTIALVEIQNGLSVARLNPLWLQAVYGLVIVAAVLVAQLSNRRSRRGEVRA